jgi:hypothetical protein
MDPSIKFIEKWAYTALAKQPNTSVTQVCELSTSVFLIAFNSKESRDHILRSTPIYLGARMVLVLPYSTSINIRELQCKLTPIWVDLLNVHPVLEIQALNMLESIGPVLHYPITTTRSKFSSI